MDEKKAAIFQAEIERISDTLFDHSVTETPIKSRTQRNTVNFLPETPGTPNCSTSDNPSYVAHDLALLNEIQTWCVVREGRCHKKGGFFLNQYC